jgi:hypothetical protein
LLLGGRGRKGKFGRTPTTEVRAHVCAHVPAGARLCVCVCVCVRTCVRACVRACAVQYPRVPNSAMECPADVTYGRRVRIRPLADSEYPAVP